MHCPLIFIFLLIAFHSFSQNNAIPSIELDESDGLPISYMQRGLQSYSGLIWGFGHQGGLFRYDGNIKTYTKKENNLSSDFIDLVLEAPDSLLWITGGMTGELILDISIFNPITEQAVSIKDFFEEPLPFNPTNVILSKNYDGFISILNIENGKIYEYNGKKISYWGQIPLSIIPDLPNRGHQGDFLIKKRDKHSYALLTEQDDKLKEVFYIDSAGAILQQKKIPSKFKDYIHHHTRSCQLTLTKNKDLLIELGNPSGVMVFLMKIDSMQNISILDSIPLLQDVSYQNSKNYIFRFLDEKIDIYDLNMQLLHELYVSKVSKFIFFDQQNGIWIAQGHTKLTRIPIPESRFKTYQGHLLNNLCKSPARGIVENKDGTIFIAQQSHLLQISKANKIRFYQGDRAIYEDLKGLQIQANKDLLWLSDELGIWKADLNNLVNPGIFYPDKKEGKLERVWLSYTDKKEHTWIGSTTGLYIVNEQDTSLDQYPKNNDYDIITKSSIFFFHENAAGIWVLSSQGIFLLDHQKGILAHYHTEGEGKYRLPHNIISHLKEDEDGSFWLTSKGGGLIHWHPEKGLIDQFTKQDGLSNDVIYAVYEDDYNQLWLPSNYGLMRFDKESKEVIRYLLEDGLPSLEFNTISHFKASDGKLYFGGLKGSIAFHPKDFIPKKSIYPLLITSFRKQGYDGSVQTKNYAQINQDKQLTLTSEDKSFELNFALLDFKNIKNNFYAYKIEGYDNDWQYTKTPSIKLNTLPSGNYKLYIKAQASGKAWQFLDAPINILVLPPFYLQTWFLVLVSILFIFFITIVFRWRVANLNKRKDELELIVKERTLEIVQQAEQLKVLDKVKSRFFANITHELRTPLTLILGPVSSLQEQVFETLEKKEFDTHTQLIKQNGHKLLTLIEEILELSKLEGGKVQLQEKPIAFYPYIRRVFSAFESLAQLQNINYILDYQANKDLNLSMDPLKLEKIVNNLLNNAFKFTPSKGNITLSVKEQEDSVLLILKDDGQGIRAEDLPHVFERFYQSQSPTLEAQGGTGIGLALCYEFAQLMNGSIRVESKIKEGSSFYFNFPKKEIQSHPKALNIDLPLTEPTPIFEQEASFVPKDKTLLLVEDNVDMRYFITALLEETYTILIAKNGLEGLDQLKLHAPDIDLIISDVMMPFMDGFTMLEEIKANENWRSLPVILLTARASEKDKLNGLTIGVDDYLIKPFSSQELQVRIKNLLQNYETRQSWKPELLIAQNQKKQQNTPETPTETPILKKETPSISSAELKWIKEVETHIKNHLNEADFDIAFLAQKLFLSRRQVNRKITKITGLSSSKFIREVRLQTAREYLEKHSFSSVAEVSETIGIQTTSYFIKQYKERFGKAPKAYFE